jgi:16S rRNA (cytosine1402-N4)-methyltransferase
MTPPVEPPHVSVMLAETLEYLNIRPDGAYADCTAGAGGHSEAIARQLNQDGRLLALDRDAGAVQLASDRLAAFAGVRVVHADYRRLAAVAAEHGLEALDGVLIDAGVSSMQLDQAERGFSFQQDGPLDMRMDPSQGVPASALLAGMSQDAIASVLREYGDIRLAGRIARVIRERADRGTLETTGDLADAVSEALNLGGKRAEETRAVFQAVRIAVNDELGALAAALRDAAALLRPGGRLVVIAFHSGEDRVAKQCMRELSRTRRELHPDGRVKQAHPPVLRVLTPKPVMPAPEEMQRNPRSKSARLRAAERV